MSQVGVGGFFPDEHRYPVRVQLEDISGGQHVYNGQFLRFVERARTDLFRLAGELNGLAELPPYEEYQVVAVEQRFLAPASLHDVLVVATRLAHVGRSSCVLEHVIRRDATEVATARVTLVFVLDGKSTQQPIAWIDRFRQGTSVG